MSESGKAPVWRAIESAPRNGQLVLLCVPDAMTFRSSRVPSDRHVFGHHALVGRWHTGPAGGASQWVSDLRILDDHDGDIVWHFECIEPTHWMALPPPPPSAGWCDVSTSLPPLKTFALLFDPKVREVREDPMVGPVADDPAANMVVGCLTDRQPDFLPQWVTDLFEASSDPVFSEDIVREQVILMPPYWYELPSMLGD